MNILIDKVRVKNFRTLKNLEMNLKPITILVGANNSGKTTLLRALNSALGMTRNQINQDDLFIDKNGDKPSNTITIDIRIIPTDEKGKRISQFDNKWNSRLGFLDVQTENDNEYVAFRTTYQFDIEDSPITTCQSFINWEDKILKIGELKGINQIRNNIKMYFIDAQRDILEDSKQRTSFFGKLVSQLDYGENLDDLKSQIASLNEEAIDKSEVLKHLRDELKKLNQTTQTQGNGISLNPFPKKVSDLHKGMKVYFQDSESDSFSMENHGMGTRSWASIITAGAFTSWQVRQIDQKIEKGEETDLLFPIFALEEPEAHLHPNAQRTLYKQLKGFKGQKIVSTHSPYIAGQAELDELRHFYKDSDASMVSEIDLSTLGPKEILRIKEAVYSSNGDVLFSNLTVMSEGKTESILMPIFAQEYFKQSPFELGIDFVATGKFYPLLTLLRFLRVKWMIFSDYDKPDVKSALDDVLKNNQVLIHDNVIKLNDENTQKDIEEYLFDEGYSIELREALKQLKTPEYHNEQHREAKQAELRVTYTEIDALVKEDVLKEIRNWKVKAARIYVGLILKRNGIDRIPQKVRELFDKISEQLNLKLKDEQSSII
jgi:putative ATP-dependent endonuclease of OLD family